MLSPDLVILTAVAYVGLLFLLAYLSDARARRSDASARFSATVELNLTCCAMSQDTVRIQSTGGTYGFAVDAFKGAIEKAIESSISDRAKALCR